MGALLEELDSNASPTVDRPFVGLEPVGDDAKKGGLAGAVDADDTESVAIGDRDRQIAQQWSVGLSEGDALKIDEHAHLFKGTGTFPVLVLRLFDLALRDWGSPGVP
jgi:hypothetical protein